MSNKGIHLIMPMGGRGSRFSKEGFDLPKPLIEINENPFLYWATQSIRKFVDLRSLTFVILQEHIAAYGIDEVITGYFPEAKFVVIPEVLNGAVLTCAEGLKGIQDDAPILFNDCDHMFQCSAFYEFCQKGNFEELDGALLTFTSSEPKYSFLEYDAKGNVVRTVEKQVISTDAICGAYYFRNKSVFNESIDAYLRECSYQEYFVSGLYNVMAGKKQIIRSFKVDVHVPFGTPEEYEKALGSKVFEVLR